MRNIFDRVAEWQRLIGREIPSKPSIRKTPESYTAWDCVLEEDSETIDAWCAGDVAEFADGLVDSIWTRIALAVSCGIDLAPVWDEVERANFDKIGGPKREDGKQLKPDGWRSPDIRGALGRGKDLSK